MHLFLALFAPLLLVHSAGAQRLEKSTDAMGATFSVVLYGSDQELMNRAIDAAFEEVHRLDELLSNYKPASEWSRINRDAALGPVVVSSESFQLLSDCIEYSRASEGTFDVTVGPLMRAWGFFGGDRKVPSSDQIREALEIVGSHHIQLNAQKWTVHFDHPGVEIDPGGVGKGYAVDRMVEILRSRGFRNALVAASGSSIFGLGNPPEEPRGWPISIADPWDHRKNAAQVFLKDMSLFNLRQLREVISCRRTSLLAYHGSPPRRSCRKRCSGDGRCAPCHRQRGVGEALLHSRKCLDRGAQAEVLARPLLRKYSWRRMLLGRVGRSTRAVS